MRNLIFVMLLASLIQLQDVQRAAAQAVSTLPRQDYYIARELLAAGRLPEASAGFQSALSTARRVGETRWVDSIPPLVAQGEVFYLQGALAAAMEQYDAALMLALANPQWIDFLSVANEELPPFETSARGISWFRKSRAGRLVAVPEALQIEVDPLNAAVDPNQQAVVAPVSLVTRLDATEVFRSLAIALRRRAQILGPLAKHSPLASPLKQLFARNPRQQVAWVQASWQVLRGLNALGSDTPIDAPKQILNGSMIGGSFDYYMGPIALLALGEFEAEQGRFQSAGIKLQDACLLAAAFDQLDLLAESAEQLGSIGAANQRMELFEPLQQIATWAAKRSGRVSATALLGAAELQIYARNFAQADKLIKQCGGILRRREISLPRQDANASYLLAMIAFGENRTRLGLSNLNSALGVMRGSADTGAVVEAIFQAQMTLDLLAGSALTNKQADELLATIILEPAPMAWRLRPLKTIAKLTTASMPAFERRLQLALQRNDEEQIIARVDRLQRQRLFEALPLGGRLLAWRDALTTEPANLGQESRQLIQATRQALPQLANIPTEIEAAIQELRTRSVPVDLRQMTTESKKLYARIKEASEQFENQTALQSLTRKPLARRLPSPVDVASLRDKCEAKDLLLGFAVTSQQLVGIAVTKDATRTWEVTELPALESQLKQLLAQIGLGRRATPDVPVQADWQQTAQGLVDLLLPVEVREMVDTSERVVLVPHSQLWYLPFEMLPLGSAGNEPLIRRHRVTYVPTLGSYALAKQPKTPVGRSLVITDKFFVVDKESNSLLNQSVVSARPNSSELAIQPKLDAAEAAWLKLSVDQLTVLSKVPAQSSAWDTVPMPLGKPLQDRLGDWMVTPKIGPANLILPGYQTSLGVGQLGNGDEVFLPACSAMFGGVKTAVVSRWHVGGESSSRILSRYRQEVTTSGSSSALRRAVLSLWAEEFLTANEPILLPAPKNAPALTSGFEPVLWTGYMSIGDNR